MRRFTELGYTPLESLMLYDMFCAITQANQWDWLSKYEPPKDKGFTLAVTAELVQIDSFIEYKDHSGASYAWCMRQMQLIAKHGFRGLAKIRGVNMDWDTFVKEMESKPEFKEQVDTLHKFEKGEITYAEMRELCG
jgi:hypothetical protein